MIELLQIVDQLNKDALGWGAIIVLLLSLVQISPIKINPWSFIARHIGRALTGESCSMMSDHMHQIDSALNDIERTIHVLEDKLEESANKADMDRAITSRVRILRFNDEILATRRHSKESFDQALTDIDSYEHYCHTHPEFKNNKTVLSISNIKKVYERQLATHDFLVNGTGDTNENTKE